MVLELGSFGVVEKYRLVEEDFLIRGGFRFKHYMMEYEMARKEWSEFCTKKQFAHLVEDELLQAFNEVDSEFRTCRGMKQIEWSGEYGKIKLENYVWAELKK